MVVCPDAQVFFLGFSHKRDRDCVNIAFVAVPLDCFTISHSSKLVVFFFPPCLRIPLVFIGIHCLVLCLDNPFPHVFMGEGDWEQDVSSMSKMQMLNRAYEWQHIRLPDFSRHVTLYLKK